MLSIRYHKIFDYNLTKEELVKWQYKNYKETSDGVKNKSRLQREKYSEKKIKIAKSAAKILSFIPTIKMVAITGSLAMMNANKDSDIDLMLITKKGTLWLTRLAAYLLLVSTHYSLRRSTSKSEKDKLCLNIWLDETDLEWQKSERNLYSAHEIAQITPLINKDRTYEKLLRVNRWILEYWPNSVHIGGIKHKVSSMQGSNPLSFLEKLAFFAQYKYMKPKMTREVVTPTRALFHPQDWGKVVLDRLRGYL